MPRATRQAGSRAGPGDVANRLHSAAIHLLRRLRVEDAAAGLSGPRLSALSVVVFGGPVTLGQLAKAEQVRPPTMSRLVAGLARAGLVSTERDPADRRVQRIQATARGRSLLEAGRARRVRRLTRDLAALSRDEYGNLLRALDVLERLARGER
jgi:DNA-binding MarR family transcriptional regulator